MRSRLKMAAGKYLIRKNKAGDSKLDAVVQKVWSFCIKTYESSQTVHPKVYRRTDKSEIFENPLKHGVQRDYLQHL